MAKLLQSRRQGAALPLVVTVVLILLAMGVGLLSLGHNARIYAIRISSDIAARCAADTGLTIALYEMNQKLILKPYNEGILPAATDLELPCTDQVCSYEVTGDLASGYVITSVGRYGKAQRSVSARLVLGSPFTHAILTKNDLKLKSNTIVDGYNSLDPFDTNIEINIGTQNNADNSVILNRGTIVKGDVFAGLGGDLNTVIKDLGAKVENKYASAPEPLPSVTAPVLPDRPAINVAGKTVILTPEDSGTYPAVYLRQLVVADDDEPIRTPSVLDVGGGDVVLCLTGDIQLGNSCEIIVKPDSTLTIYTAGNIHARNGSSISTETSPKESNTIKIYATGTDKQFFDIKAKSDFSGLIYAPNAEVILYAKGDVYGSIVAENFTLMSGGNYYYDKALSKVTADDEGVYFAVTQWQESARRPLQ